MKKRSTMSIWRVESGEWRKKREKMEHAPVSSRPPGRDPVFGVPMISQGQVRSERRKYWIRRLPQLTLAISPNCLLVIYLCNLRYLRELSFLYSLFSFLLSMIFPSCPVSPAARQQLQQSPPRRQHWAPWHASAGSWCGHIAAPPPGKPWRWRERRIHRHCR